MTDPTYEKLRELGLQGLIDQLEEAGKQGTYFFYKFQENPEAVSHAVVNAIWPEIMTMVLFAVKDRTQPLIEQIQSERQRWNDAEELAKDHPELKKLLDEATARYVKRNNV